jgi:hypothetical protein
MGGPAWQGRSSLTRERALQRAVALDEKTHGQIEQAVFPLPHKLFSEIRAFLLRRSEEMDTKNNPIQHLKFTENNGVAWIALGPQIDKGSTPQHFHFDSGARLSFGLTVRELDGGSQLVAFRFNYHRSEARTPEYFRFDLNKAPHEDPLSEPRCHLHPGLDELRIPISMHDPIEILDRIFFDLERKLSAV